MFFVQKAKAKANMSTAVNWMYDDKDDYVTVGRLSMVYIDRERCAAEETNLTDGFTLSPEWTITSTTYWLIGGTRCSVKCVKDYQHAELKSTKIHYNGECRMTENEYCIINLCSMLASSSASIREDVAKIYTFAKVEIPRCFINHIVKKFGLYDWRYDKSSKVLKTYEELLATEK